MVSIDFLRKHLGKDVHVDYLDSEDNMVVWTEGLLKNYDEDALEIETETDFDRIPIKDIRKIYIKVKE